MKDPIVEEVREWGAKIAEECGYDLKKILAHARATADRIPGLKHVTKAELKARRAAKSQSGAPKI